MPSQYVSGTGTLASVVGLRKVRLPLQLCTKGSKLVFLQHQPKLSFRGGVSFATDVLLSVCVSVLHSAMQPL